MKMYKIIIACLFLFTLIFISGCVKETEVCNKPYIKIGNECCLDQNNNGICDKDETKKIEEGETKKVEEEKKVEKVLAICGNNICESGENYENCCLDCACPKNYFCDETTKKCTLAKPDLRYTYNMESSKSATVLYSLPERIINERYPLIQAEIKNIGKRKAENVQLKTKLGEYSDWNTRNIGIIEEGASSYTNITPRANSNILSITTETNVPILFELTYSDTSGQSYKKEDTKEITIKGRNTFSWAYPELTAAWITPAEPGIRDFATQATASLAQGYIDNHILPAVWRIFNDAGAFGVRYTSDPSGPRGDYVQFPIETLHRRNGDCDDMAVLFASLLRAVGIRAGVVLVPGHAFTWFEINNTKYTLEGTGVGNEVTESFFRTSLEETLSILEENQYEIIEPEEEWYMQDVKMVNLPNPPVISIPQININIQNINCYSSIGGKWYHCEADVVFTNSGGQGYRCVKIINYEKENYYRKDNITICTNVPAGTTIKKIDLDADAGKEYEFIKVIVPCATCEESFL